MNWCTIFLTNRGHISMKKTHACLNFNSTIGTLGIYNLRSSNFSEDYLLQLKANSHAVTESKL